MLHAECTLSSSHKYNNIRAFSGQDRPDNKQNRVNNQNSFLKSADMFRLFKTIPLKTADIYGYTTVKPDTCTYINTKFPFPYNHGNSHQKIQTARSTQGTAVSAITAEQREKLHLRLISRYSPGYRGVS